MRIKTKQFACWVEVRGARFHVQEILSAKEGEIEMLSGGNRTRLVMLSYQYQFKGWEGVRDEEGKEISFSPEALDQAIENDIQSLNEAMVEFRTKRNEHYAAIRAAEKN